MNSPFLSVRTVSPFLKALTVAPCSGLPFSSITLPLLFCARESMGNSSIPAIKIDFIELKFWLLINDLGDARGCWI
jgi:hypothetical protein